MTDLFWPGDERAGERMTPGAWLVAMLRVEQAWLDTLAGAGVAPEAPRLAGLVDETDIPALAAAAEAGGNPVIPLIALLRERAGGEGGPWVHRGLTSQDVLDSALMLCLHDVVEDLRAAIVEQAETLMELALTHRLDVQAGRTLGQQAVPITFGLTAAGWLDGIIDAGRCLDALTFPAQLGGAAGTLAAVTELVSDRADPVSEALVFAGDAARRMPLLPSSPWHTRRGPVTAIGDALVACTDAWGRIGTDVVTLSRTEIAEVAESGAGRSSTMPHKQNPVRSTLLRRAAIWAPGAASDLHISAALGEDRRAAGAWHAEWGTLRDLARRTLTAASHCTELVGGLRVDTGTMRATVHAGLSDLTAERTSIAEFCGRPPSEDPYIGASASLVDLSRSRARTWLEAHA